MSLNNILIIVCLFIVMDLITGVLQSIKNKNFSSRVMREGLFHKVGVLLSLALGILIDYSQNFINLSINVPVMEGIAVYVITMEIGSIIENIYHLNPEILPENLKSILKIVGGKNGGNDTK